ncbi:NAD(P)H-binding protein [Streptosporangium sp. NBC_01639]|uniref:NmrA family NAD(P)-binding protein n=1 Tax=Streptosporangium sp. NBC_01639 TaxID=2975948 RepID=UPI00386EC73A|nr:NAD(P)H-binding protein [Streptosporangium sp. NBC_01639]
MILVTGATGNVGRNVVRQLLDAGEKVRTITRNPESAGLPDGVEVLPGDLTRPETLPAALRGVEQAFLFPVFGSLDDFLRIGKESGLEQVVLLSSAAVTFPTSNWIGDRHLECERAVEESGLSWTHVRPGMFMANDLAWAAQIATGDVVRAPYGDAAAAPIDERDIAAVIVRALLDRQAGEAHLIGGTESLTQIERVRILGEAIGRPLRFEELPREQAREHMIGHLPPQAVDFMLDGLASAVGRPAEVSSVVEKVTGRPAHTYAQWAAHHADDFRRTSA